MSNHLHSLGVPEDLSQDEDESSGLGKQESKAIWRLKIVALLTLLSVGGAMAWLTYALVREQESASFESAFHEQASRMINKFYEHLTNKMWIASTIGLAISNQGVFGTFPYVTVPSFETIGFGQLQLIGGASFGFAPLIRNETERTAWETYAVEQARLAGYNETSSDALDDVGDLAWKGRAIVDGIFEFYKGNWPAQRQGPGPYSPVWQVAPIAKTRRGVLLDQFSEPVRAKALAHMLDHGNPVYTGFLDESFETKITYNYTGPRSILFSPLRFNDEIVGSIQIESEWAKVFADTTAGPLVAVLDNSCGEVVSFEASGCKVKYLGVGDHHTYERSEMSSSPEALESSWMSFFEGIDSHHVEQHLFDMNHSSSSSCMYSMRVYPSSGFQDEFFTDRPAVYTAVVASVFVVCVLVFLAYNFLVERRQKMILDTAVRSNEVINSLFPPKFRDRLFSASNKKQRLELEESKFFKAVASQKLRLTSLLSNNKYYHHSDEEPIADVFSNTTVIFADIAGFTAWSSQREPYQVFKLLETIYHDFDAIAKSLGVFKVETIGDCYVAVTGLPTPQEDHAVRMGRFATEILAKMDQLTKQLEKTLGPGTSELALRIGCHSGAVTAGVLRGDKSRFQLFGDTMNVASRMESTSLARKVQVSMETAALIEAAQKGHWLVKRQSAVQAKGLGLLETYWLNTEEVKSQGVAPKTFVGEELENDESNVSHHWGDLALESSTFTQKFERLIDWNVEVLLSFLTKLGENRIDPDGHVASVNVNGKIADMGEGKSIFSEVTEVIELPPFNARSAHGSLITKYVVSTKVRAQLWDYVSRIASMYQDVPFHNFEHASHVALSANKLMRRIISPDEVSSNQRNGKKKKKSELYAADLHNTTFGISSDPLTQFAIVFAALVHDVEHHGVPNVQLVKEQHDIAVKYGNKSVAEQHSVNLALTMLSESKYKDLYACICATENEKVRFRQLLINSVMATDIVDQELRSLRENRWSKAFAAQRQGGIGKEDINRKATIVLEHIIQASDVAHTMQHWHVFCKWNERLYKEMYIAYLDGRAEKDPSEGWYEGEIAFFDFYIIPLARNLKDCGVFGVSSDECLASAVANREEWRVKGKGMTERLLAQRDEIIRSRVAKQVASFSMTQSAGD